MEYFNRVAASFTSTEHGKQMVRRVKRPVEPSGAG